MQDFDITVDLFSSPDTMGTRWSHTAHILPTAFVSVVIATPLPVWPSEFRMENNNDQYE
jgi:hypothetical protein